MKDFVREYGKIAGVPAAAALLLSFLIGLIAGNPFGVVCLRAFLFAILFGGIGAGGRFLVLKYLPELASMKPGPAADGGAAGPEKRPVDDVRGRAVNIVLPEEPMPVQEASGAEPMGTLDLGGADDELESAVESLGDDGAESLPDSLLGEGELSPTAEGLGDAAIAEEDGGEASELLDEGGVGASPETLAPSSGEDMDALPDISGLESIDGGSGGQGGARGERKGHSSLAGKSGNPSEAMREAVSGEDPATIAKAIRTVLNREEKG